MKKDITSYSLRRRINRASGMPPHCYLCDLPVETGQLYYDVPDRDKCAHKACTEPELVR